MSHRPSRRPFNALTLLGDQSIDQHADFAVAALAALVPALDAARAAGDQAHFDRLAGNFQRYRQELLALDPQATIPDASLDFAVGAHARQAA